MNKTKLFVCQIFVNQEQYFWAIFRTEQRLEQARELSKRENVEYGWEILSESPKVRHGKARSKKSISANLVNVVKEIFEMKDKGKKVDDQSTSKLESPNTNDAKINEVEVVEIVDKFRHGVLKADTKVFIPRSSPE
jgi:hypothetical protein